MVNAVLTDRGRTVSPRRRAPAPLLDGIRRADWTGRPRAARRLGAFLADRGEVAYCIGTLDAPQTADRGAGARESVRTRESVLTRSSGFFHATVCGLRDRVLNGLSLPLTRDLRLPWRFAVRRAETGDGRSAIVGGRLGVPMRRPA